MVSKPFNVKHNVHVETDENGIVGLKVMLLIPEYARFKSLTLITGFTPRMVNTHERGHIF
jgi:hypothetical protein